MVFFGCEVLGSHVYGDHTIYVGLVKEMRRNESGAPLMFYNSRWYNPAAD
jgi:flavin reductase (DIM6/NTAB) family NADH-FMN oxidoreductase RutF